MKMLQPTPIFHDPLLLSSWSDDSSKFDYLNSDVKSNAQISNRNHFLSSEFSCRENEHKFRGTHRANDCPFLHCWALQCDSLENIEKVKLKLLPPIHWIVSLGVPFAGVPEQFIFAQQNKERNIIAERVKASSFVNSRHCSFFGNVLRVPTFHLLLDNLK